MPVANWKTQVYNAIQSLLYNNPHRIISYRVRDADGKEYNRADRPAPVRRLYETECAPERTCLQTVQFVHHMLIPPGGRHVHELHTHPDAEELVVITRGRGTARIGQSTFAVAQEDVLYIPPHAEHEVSNTSDELLGVLFINIPVGEGLKNLQAAQAARAAEQAAARAPEVL